MRIIVDANIVFSAILNTNSRVADLLINSESVFEFISHDYLKTELRKYHSKIAMISKMTAKEIEIIEFKITKPITFMSGVNVPSSVWIQSETLTKDLDDKDIPYVAFSLFYNCKIWSGDKVLRKGLELKGMKNVISTEEIFDYRDAKRDIIK